ncbi:MAG: uncharacterized protein QOJ89_1816, partial [bacterium]
HEQLVARRKELDDNPIPSGASSAAFGLLRLAALTGQARYERHAIDVLLLAGTLAQRYPPGFGHLLQALDFHHARVREIALVGDDTSALQDVVRSRFRPHVVLAGGDGSDAHGIALLEGRGPLDGRPAAYVCERFSCRQPVSEPQDLAALLDAPSP